MDFTVLKRAGVPQEFFGGLLKVSTPAVNKWVKGGNVHPARVTAVSKMLSVLETALAEGRLPVHADTREERIAGLKKIILAALRPASQEA